MLGELDDKVQNRLSVITGDPQLREVRPSKGWIELEEHAFRNIRKHRLCVVDAADVDIHLTHCTLPLATTATGKLVGRVARTGAGARTSVLS